MVKTFFFLRNTPSQILKNVSQTNPRNKGIVASSVLFDVENSALNWLKLENCAQTLLGKSTNDVKGSLHIIIIDKQFLTLGWKAAQRSAFKKKITHTIYTDVCSTVYSALSRVLWKQSQGFYSGGIRTHHLCNPSPWKKKSNLTQYRKPSRQQTSHVKNSQVLLWFNIDVVRIPYRAGTWVQVRYP